MDEAHGDDTTLGPAAGEPDKPQLAHRSRSSKQRTTPAKSTADTPSPTHGKEDDPELAQVLVEIHRHASGSAPPPDLSTPPMSMSEADPQNATQANTQARNAPMLPPPSPTVRTPRKQQQQKRPAGVLGLAPLTRTASAAAANRGSPPNRQLMHAPAAAAAAGSHTPLLPTQVLQPAAGDVSPLARSTAAAGTAGRHSSSSPPARKPACTSTSPAARESTPGGESRTHTQTYWCISPLIPSMEAHCTATCVHKVVALYLAGQSAALWLCTAVEACGTLHW